MNAARLQRAEIQRRSLEAQLQALQTRVEPRFLFDMLARARDRYERDPAQGSAALAALITYLRAALPRVREAASDITREIELARAYIDVLRASGDTSLRFVASVADGARTARIPAMLVLPLVHEMQRSASGDVGLRMTAVRDRDTLRVSIACDGGRSIAAQPGADVAPIRERLAALYRGTARLAFDTRPDRSSVCILEVPFEPGDGSHR
jgi:LytS/YehU family sensor histidine kinase